MTGAVLAGGAGRRLGRGSKPAAVVAGRPLVSYPLAAMTALCDHRAVVCKPDSVLPELEDGVERWDEPDEARHPRAGIVHALERADGPVLVCAADMPFVTEDAFRTLLGAAGSAPAAVAVADGILQPVLGVFAPVALETLRAAEPNSSLTSSVEALSPARVALPAALVRSVNTPGELAEAERELSA